MKDRRERTPYREQVQEVIRFSDLIIEVVDARFPKDSRNLGLEKDIIRAGKQLLIVIAKMDLVPEAFLKSTHKDLCQEFPCVYLSNTEHHGSKRLFEIINRMRDGKSIRIGVIGYPNVGKSSVINLLRGHHSAPTSPLPGHTKSIQWVRISKEILLVDTPGVVPLKGQRGLFLKGAMVIEKAENPVRVIYNFFDDLKRRDVFKKLQEHYKISEEDNEAFLTELARKQQMLLKGGLLDLNRAARRVYIDWLKGRIKLHW